MGIRKLLISGLVCLYKGHFRRIYLYLLDKDFREDINFIAEIKKQKLKKIRAKVPLYAIEHSHRVIYRNWVRTLVAEYCDSLNNYDLIELYEYAPGKFLPLDGNHRLAALNITHSKADDVEVFLWVLDTPKEKGNIVMNKESLTVNRQLLPDLKDKALKN